MSDLKECPFCGGEAVVREDRKGFQIVGCKKLSMLCPNPSIVVYKNGAGGYNYSPWNNRASTPNAKIQELIDKYDGMCDLHFLELLDGLKQLIEGE